MAEEAKRSSGAGARAVLWFVILLLLGAVWFLASERNERRYTLSARGQTLVVSRGRFFPMGFAALQEKPYEPVAIPAGEKLPFSGEAEYDDQNAVDRALFDLLFGWAKKGGSNASALAERASELPGLTGAQLAQLQALKSELIFTLAQQDEEQARKLLVSAQQRLEAVKDARGDHAPEAAQELSRLQAALKLLAK